MMMNPARCPSREAEQGDWLTTPTPTRQASPDPGPGLACYRAGSGERLRPGTRGTGARQRLRRRYLPRRFRPPQRLAAPTFLPPSDTRDRPESRRHTTGLRQRRAPAPSTTVSSPSCISPARRKKAKKQTSDTPPRDVPPLLLLSARVCLATRAIRVQQAASAP